MKKIIIAILFLCTLTANTYAERLPIRKFSGLNTRLNEYEIGDNESPEMENFMLDKAGSLTERNLFRRYNSTSIASNSINNVYKFYKSSDVGYLLCSSEGSIYSASGGTLTSLLNKAVTATNVTKFRFETFTDGTQEVVIAMDNSIAPFLWNGTNSVFAQQGGHPATHCAFSKKHKARLWAAGSSSYPYRIYYCTLTDCDDWILSGGSIDLPSYERIMALESFNDTLFIFTRSAIYAILGDTPYEFSMRQTRSLVGTHATDSVILGDRYIFFLNKSGVFAFNGDTSECISETIQPTIDEISPTYIENAVGLYDKRGRYWVSYTKDGTFNDTILIYDTVIKQWYPLSGTYLASIYKTEGGNDKGEVYAGNSDDSGWLWQLQSSSAIESVSHGTKPQLSTGVTFNSTILGTNAWGELRLRGISQPVTFNTTLLINFDGAEDQTSTKDVSGYDYTVRLRRTQSYRMKNHGQCTPVLTLTGITIMFTFPITRIGTSGVTHSRYISGGIRQIQVWKMN